MIISREYTTTPKLALSDMLEDAISLCKGILTRVSVQSAPGVNGEVFIRVLHFESALLPNEPDQWIPLTGMLQNFPMHFNDWNDVYYLVVQLCAPDARFEHRINVEIEITEQETAEQIMSDFIDMGFQWQTR